MKDWRVITALIGLIIIAITLIITDGNEQIVVTCIGLIAALGGVSLARKINNSSKP